MKVTEEKRPYGGIDKHLITLVLVFSIVNILKQLFNLNSDFHANTINSILVSLFGIYIYYLNFKKQKRLNLLLIFWSITQLIIIEIYPNIYFDLSQGFYLRIGPSFKHTINGTPITKYFVRLNILAVLFLAGIYFRHKHAYYYKSIYISPISSEDILPFNTKILKTYTMPNNKRLLILSKTHGAKSYALQVEQTDVLEFSNSTAEYILCEIDTLTTIQESFSPYSVKQLGQVKITYTE